MKAAQVRMGGWYDCGGKLYQRLRNLNGSNAYCFSDGTYAYVEPTALVLEATTPRHTAYTCAKLKTILHLYDDGTFRVHSGEE